MKRVCGLICAALLSVSLSGAPALAACPVEALQAQTPARVTQDVSAHVRIDAPVRMGLLPGITAVSVRDARLLSFLDTPPSIFSAAPVVREEDMHFCYTYDVYGKAQHFEGGASLYRWSDGNISFWDAHGDAVGRVWHLYRAEIEMLSPEASAGAERALEKALQAAEAVGFPASRDAWACAFLSAETVAAYLERFSQDAPKSAFQQLDTLAERLGEGCYVFTFPAVYEGLALEDFFYISPANGEHITARPLEVIVASDELLSFDAMNACEAAAVRRQAAEVLSLQEATGALAARLAQEPPSAPMVVYEISFAYGLEATDDGPDVFSLVPCWFFRGIDRDIFLGPAQAFESAKDANTTLFMLNAVSGEWVS